MRILGFNRAEAMVIVFCILFLVALIAMAIDARWLAWPWLLYTAICLCLVGHSFFKYRHMKSRWVRLPGPPGKNDPGSGENKDTKI